MAPERKKPAKLPAKPQKRGGEKTFVHLKRLPAQKSDYLQLSHRLERSANTQGISGTGVVSVKRLSTIVIYN